MPSERIGYILEDRECGLVTRLAPNRVRCGLCGTLVRAPYKAQSPAPCGEECAWSWEEGLLLACPLQDRDAAY